ncbi:serine/threonine-protein kinase pim-2-like [Siphateles boraxobius]|uniref:serine/threonine-protein kinase pim-2-like n=1 Tax=Siphateles boraxobius TaxID=180520 RepID=UPI004062EAFC
MARHVMLQVINTANICCERDVFHRDIKLENLLLNPDTMEVKLIDFGCSAIMKKTAFKVFSGTKAYQPPEIRFQGRYHVKPMTVWSLGILLFEMLCEDHPTAHDLNTISANIWTNSDLSQGHKTENINKQLQSRLSCCSVHPSPQVSYCEAGKKITGKEVRASTQSCCKILLEKQPTRTSP